MQKLQCRNINSISCYINVESFGMITCIDVNLVDAGVVLRNGAFHNTTIVIRSDKKGLIAFPITQHCVAVTS